MAAVDRADLGGLQRFGRFAGGRRQRFGQFSAESPLGGFRRASGGRGQRQQLEGQGAVATAAEGYGSCL